MKGMLKKFVAVAATVLFWSSQANALLIEIDPSTVGPVTAGDPISLDIVASDLGDDFITAYDILIAFDDSLMTASSVTWGCNLGACDGLSFLDAFIAGPGLVDAAELSVLFDFEFPLYQDGSDFVLFTLNLFAVADFDTTTFDFVWDEFHDVKCGNNEVCFPAAVPEPGTLALLGLGLLGMAISRRRLLS